MKVLLSYFRRSGKWYSDGEYETECVVENGNPSKPLYMIWHEVEQFQIAGDLPGLVHSDNGRFEYIILIDVPDHPHRHPHLIV